MFLEVLKDMRIYRDNEEYRETRSKYEEKYQGRPIKRRLKVTEQVEEAMNIVPISHSSFNIEC
jgi:hypothetical protein